MINFFRSPKNDELQNIDKREHENNGIKNDEAYIVDPQNKCTSCGAIIEADEMFCGNCGMKVAAKKLESVAEAYCSEPRYVNIGHPMGYSDEEGKIFYLIDSGIDHVRISQELFNYWANMPQEQPDEQIGFILGNMECVIDIGGKVGCDAFLKCIPYRQGFGAVVDKKHAIMLGRTPIYITETQMMVWRFADGRKTLYDIATESGLDTTAVIDAAVELINYDLIYVKHTR
ncbi:MAG: zinc ribbon domain-containing protein [Ruminococcaceae bacterium]|nr:zinc ribbon domain-containing protein [Oscillospiraceae bacterium]